MMYNHTMEKNQRTSKGHEIPVPKRKDFDTVLDAVATPVKKPPKKPSRVRGPKK